MKFLLDTPSKDDELRTHKPIASAVFAHLEAEFSGPFVIGLFGNWGSGKSSIVYWLKELVSGSRNKFAYAEVDAWKAGEAYFGVSFVRSLAHACLSKKNRNKVLRKISTKKIRERSYLQRDGAAFVAVLLALLVIVLSVLVVRGQSVNPNVPWVGIASFVFSSLALVLVQLFLSSFSTTTQTREEDVSFEQADAFQNILLNDILRNIKQDICCVVVDNIDRLEPEEALAVIRKLKTFIIDNEKLLERGKTKFVIVIPVDDHLLVEHVNSYAKGTGRQFLKKFFTIAIRIPSAIRTDLHQFTLAKLREAYDVTPQPINIDDLAFILNRAANRNPRDVKLVINEFVSLNLLLNASLPSPVVDLLKGNPQWLAFFIGLLFVWGEEGPPRSIAELATNAKPSISSETEDQNGDKRNFLMATQPFWTVLDERAWFWLLHHKISDLRVTFPNFDEVYVAATRGDSVELWRGLESILVEQRTEILRSLYIESAGSDVATYNITSALVNAISLGLDPTALPREAISKIDYFFGQHFQSETLLRSDFIDRSLAKVAPQLASSTIDQVFTDIDAMFNAATISENGQFSPEENPGVEFIDEFLRNIKNPENQIAPSLLERSIPHSNKIAKLTIDYPSLRDKSTMLQTQLAEKLAQDQGFFLESDVDSFTKTISENSTDFLKAFFAAYVKNLQNEPAKIGPSVQKLTYSLLELPVVRGLPELEAVGVSLCDAIRQYLSTVTGELQFMAFELLLLLGNLDNEAISKRAKERADELGKSILAGFASKNVLASLQAHHIIYSWLPTSWKVEIAKLSSEHFAEVLKKLTGGSQNTVKEMLKVDANGLADEWIASDHGDFEKLNILRAILELAEEASYDVAAYEKLSKFNFPRNDSQFLEIVYGHYEKLLVNVDYGTVAGMERLTRIFEILNVKPSQNQQEEIDSKVKELNLGGFEGDLRAFRDAYRGRDRSQDDNLDTAP